MKTGGKARQYRELAERYPIAIHGLSLSVGSLHPLSRKFLKELKVFLKEARALWMSDHLCYSSVLGAQFHDLLPLPLSREAIRHVVPRIRQVQDYLEMPFAIENVSYYALPGKPEMPEWEFLREVAERADCSLLLDVNNIYVNAVNHGFDPYEYLRDLPYERVLHIRHDSQYQVFFLDTHGAPVIDRSGPAALRLAPGQPKAISKARRAWPATAKQIAAARAPRPAYARTCCGSLQRGGARCLRPCANQRTFGGKICFDGGYRPKGRFQVYRLVTNAWSNRAEHLPSRRSLLSEKRWWQLLWAPS